MQVQSAAVAWHIYQLTRDPFALGLVGLAQFGPMFALTLYAGDVADRSGDPVRIAQVALATASLGAQFAVRRDDLVRRLDRARSLVDGVDDLWEARLAAALARELQHSVPEERPRAGPLSEHALEVGRRSNDGDTLLRCLLARPDVHAVSICTPSGTPGTGK